MGVSQRQGPRAHSKPNRRWTDDEQVLLKELVEKAKDHAKDPDKIRWSQIASHIPGRTGKQCRERWLNHTREGINKSKWTDAEEYRLAQLHCEYGTHWTSIAKQLPGRTENATKNHWTSSFRARTAREPCFFGDFVRELKEGRDKHDVLSELTAIYPHLPDEAHRLGLTVSAAGVGSDAWGQPGSAAGPGVAPGSPDASATLRTSSGPSPTSASDPCMVSSDSDESDSDQALALGGALPGSGGHRSRRRLPAEGVGLRRHGLRRMQSLQSRMQKARLAQHGLQEGADEQGSIVGDASHSMAGTTFASQVAHSVCGPHGPNPFAAELSNRPHTPLPPIVSLAAFDAAQALHAAQQMITGVGSGSGLSGPSSMRNSRHGSTPGSGRNGSPEDLAPHCSDADLVRGGSFEGNDSYGQLSCSGSQPSYNPHRMEVLPIGVPHGSKELQSTFSKLYDDMLGGQAGWSQQRQGRHRPHEAVRDMLSHPLAVDGLLQNSFSDQGMPRGTQHDAQVPDTADYDLMSMEDPLMGFRVPEDDHQLGGRVPTPGLGPDSNRFIPLKSSCILTGGGRSPGGGSDLAGLAPRAACPPTFYGGIGERRSSSLGSLPARGTDAVSKPLMASMNSLQDPGNSGLLSAFCHRLSEPLDFAAAQLHDGQHGMRPGLQQCSGAQPSAQHAVQLESASRGGSLPTTSSPVPLEPKFRISSLPARMHQADQYHGQAHDLAQLMQRPSPFAGAGGDPRLTVQDTRRMASTAERTSSLNSNSPSLLARDGSQHSSSFKRHCSDLVMQRSKSIPNQEQLPPPPVADWGREPVAPADQTYDGPNWPLPGLQHLEPLPFAPRARPAVGSMPPAWSFEPANRVQQFGSNWGGLERGPAYTGPGRSIPAQHAEQRQQVNLGRLSAGSGLSQASALAQGHATCTAASFVDPFSQVSFSTGTLVRGSRPDNPFARESAVADDFAFCRTELPSQHGGQHPQQEQRRNNSRHISRHLSEEFLEPLGGGQEGPLSHLPLRHSAGAAFGSEVNMRERLLVPEADHNLPFGSVTLPPVPTSVAVHQMAAADGTAADAPGIDRSFSATQSSDYDMGADERYGLLTGLPGAMQAPLSMPLNNSWEWGRAHDPAPANNGFGDAV